MNKVIITGASGFVGRALSNYLKQLNHDVIATSRKATTGCLQVSRYDDIPSGDIVIHLAEEADRGKVNKESTEYIQASNQLIKTLSQKCQGNLIYASTSLVYGDWASHPRSETESVSALDVYSRLKLQNEAQTLEMGGVVLRLANIFGKGMAKNNVLSDILSQLKGDKPITVRNAAPVRDFLSIRELVSLFPNIIQKPQPGIFNVGSGESISISTLAKILSAKSGLEKDIISLAAPSHKISTLSLDISKIGNVYDWRPKLSLESQLSNFIKSTE